MGKLGWFRVGGCWLVGGICLLCGSVAFAQANTWMYVDAQGVTHVGNAPATAKGGEKWLYGAQSASDGSVKDAQAVARLPGYVAAKPILESAATDQALDPALVLAVAAAESGLRSDAVSRKGAVGLMQVMPATAARYGVSGPSAQELAVELKKPHVNVQVGTRYLADLIKLFDGQLDLALAAYNAGEGAVLRHGRQIPPFPETQQYVSRVMRYYRSLSGRGLG